MAAPKKKAQQFALSVTRAVGSIPSVVAHTGLFVLSFAAVWLGALPFDRMLLILTTVVSLEAIYLAIFIQMTINFQSETIEEVEHDIDEIQEDIDELQEDVEEMNEEDKQEAAEEAQERKTLEEIKLGLERLVRDVERLQK